MGRLTTAIEIYGQQYKQYNVDYIRCKSLIHLLSTEQDEIQWNKKYDLLWCILRSEGDKHAYKLDELIKSLLYKLTGIEVTQHNLSDVWCDEFQLQLNRAAEYMILNAWLFMKLLYRIQLQCDKSNDMTIKRQRINELLLFIHDQWFEGRTSHRLLAKRIHELQPYNKNTLCQHCDRPCYFVIRHNSDKCTHSYCIIDLVNHCIRANPTHNVQVQCPVCLHSDGFNIMELSIQAINTVKQGVVSITSNTQQLIQLSNQPTPVISIHNNDIPSLCSPTNSIASSSGIRSTSNDRSPNQSYDSVATHSSTNTLDDTSHNISNRSTYDSTDTNTTTTTIINGTTKPNKQKLPGKRGFSCHQCKTSKSLSQLLVCKSHILNPQAKRCCHKKYCLTCLQWCYHMSDLIDLSVDNEKRLKWKCPSCYNICTCAACKRKHQKLNNNNSTHHLSINNKRPLTTPQTHMLPSQHHLIFDSAQQSVIKSALLQQSQYNNMFFAVTKSAIVGPPIKHEQQIINKKKIKLQSQPPPPPQPTTLQVNRYPVVEPNNNNTQWQPSSTSALNNIDVGITSNNTIPNTYYDSSTQYNQHVHPISQSTNSSDVVMNSEMISKLTVLAEQLLRAQNAGINVSGLLNHTQNNINTDNINNTVNSTYSTNNNNSSYTSVSSHSSIPINNDWPHVEGTLSHSPSINNINNNMAYNNQLSDNPSTLAPMPTMHDIFQLDYCAVDYSKLPVEQQPAFYRKQTANMPSNKTNYINQSSQLTHHDELNLLNNLQELLQQYQSTGHNTTRQCNQSNDINISYNDLGNNHTNTNDIQYQYDSSNPYNNTNDQIQPHNPYDIPNQYTPPQSALYDVHQYSTTANTNTMTNHDISQPSWMYDQSTSNTNNDMYRMM